VNPFAARANQRLGERLREVGAVEESIHRRAEVGARVASL